MSLDEIPRASLPASALSLPGWYYSDPEHHRRELERFFLGGWVHVGRLEEIPSPGDFVLREIAGESLILVRGDDGDPRAFFNVCRHRGTRLCEASAGNFAGYIRCPYHAWAFDLNGRLVAAPQMDDLPHFAREDYPLIAAVVATWDGHVFINPSGNSQPLTEHLGSLPERFRPWGMDQLRLGKRTTYDVAANWKLLIQNYSECLHCPGVHPALQRLTHFLSGENEPANDDYLGGRMSLREGIDTLTMDGTLRRPYLPGLSESDRRMVLYYAILPNLLLSLHPDYVMTHTLYPRAVNRTEIVCEWHFHPEAISAPDFSPEDAASFWDLTNRQDWHVCEQMQLGVSSRAYRPGPYSSREDLLHGFDRLVRIDG